MGTPLDQAIELAAGARRVNVFTGAGMSADSGLETYRDAVTGLWENVDPQAMASIDAWRADPEPMFAWYLWRTKLASLAEPNAGHVAISRWSLIDGTSVSVTTQNIDNLHERAGSTDVTHLHGSLFEFRCTSCGQPHRVTIPDQPAESIAPPRCESCGDLVRPGVVWFGEALPEREWERAEMDMVTADLVVIVGTSGVVYPAAGLPMLAHQMGTPIIEVTPAPTELSRLATVTVEGTAAEVLPTILAGLE
ncbi:NAD-dependent deacylase [Corynebacterium aquatimens]|uniref:NAD-dependent protein deacylase n=1 Tax=Corynebacterium aquatimens TaxID=1190508 RepID=A0A931E2Y3_9CORY|nr:NAD-dependent deacylase [Corynebacterium aquatimens]MBG6122620.1 NAD-dependent deacetylase [Corynebacterium aquatimens]WJY64840.1 NAD-dependent protein deacylase [Corynebacterium aquatimens]